MTLTPESETPFGQYVRQTSQIPTYFDPLAGNNGDRLIHMGAQEVLARTSCRLVDSPDIAERVLLNGGGAMNEFWGGGVRLFKKYREEYPQLPLVIGPSTYDISAAVFHDLCQQADAPITLYCREKLSFEKLKAMNPPEHVTIRLSPDLALELASQSWVASWRERVREDYVLVATRNDREGSGGAVTKIRCPWLPPAIRRPLARLKTRMVAGASKGTLDQLFTANDVPAGLPRIYCDVSISVDFDEFVEKVAHAAFIVTDRLHVGILAYMLNKRAVLLPGRYHKIRGVYELSLNVSGSTVSLWQAD